MLVQKINSNGYITRPSFKSQSFKSLKDCNLGALPNGIIGQIKAIKANGQEACLNLEKFASSSLETYQLKDRVGNVVGKIDFYFNKPIWIMDDETNHVFVKELRNFSNPNTPYYKKGLEEYKQIGTKLLQIAHKRSLENGCDGNIELVAKNEKFVLDFYKKLGFEQPADITYSINPYRLHLDFDKQNQLASKYGGI